MRPAFFLKESLRSMRRNVVPSFAALASVLVTTLVLGVFIPVVQATNGAANDVRRRVLVDVDLVSGASAAAVARVRAELRSAPHVKSVQYVSKKTGYEQQRKLNEAAERERLSSYPNHGRQYPRHQFDCASAPTLAMPPLIAHAY